MTDYYKILGVSSRAEDVQIKASYRKLAKRYHPDVVGDDPLKVKRMYEIQEAYRVLSDPAQRKAYDEKRSSGGQQSGFGEWTGGRNGSQEHSGRQGAGRGGPLGGGRDQGAGGPAPDMSQFERFFGFQPGKGMETYQGERRNAGKTDHPVKPEEMFASFFKNIKR